MNRPFRHGPTLSLSAIAGSPPARGAPSLRSRRKRAAVQRGTSFEQGALTAPFWEGLAQLRNRRRCLFAHLFSVLFAQRDNAVLDQDAP